MGVIDRQWKDIYDQANDYLSNPLVHDKPYIPFVTAWGGNKSQQVIPDVQGAIGGLDQVNQYKNSNNKNGGSDLPPKADENKDGGWNNKKDDEELGFYNEAIKEINGKKTGIDLSPMLALTDSLTGSNLLRGYDRPMSKDEKEATILKLREAKAKREYHLREKQAYNNELKRQTEAKERYEKKKLELEKSKIKAIYGEKQAKAFEKGQKDRLSTIKNLGSVYDKAIRSIAHKQIQLEGMEDEEGIMARVRAPLVTNQIYEFGRFLINEKGIENGYDQAVQFFLKNPGGPDAR